VIEANRADNQQAERIRTTFERNRKALELRGAIGLGTATTRVRLRDGLACEVEEGKWRLTVDMSPKSGGADSGPNPGVLGRAALGSCLAIGYAMWAAALQIPISSLEVVVEADYDTRAEYGVGGVRPGYGEVRYLVNVASPAPEADVLRLLDTAEAHSSYLAVFADPQPMRREVRIVPPEAG
jgi:uncharacterized OsmC-like protein